MLHWKQALRLFEYRHCDFPPAIFDRVELLFYFSPAIFDRVEILFERCSSSTRSKIAGDFDFD